jgi:hypothetical protein
MSRASITGALEKLAGKSADFPTKAIRSSAIAMAPSVMIRRAGSTVTIQPAFLITRLVNERPPASN